MHDPEQPQPLPEPPNLRFLRRLVTTLTAVMILGLLTIVALFVIRFSGDRTGPVLPPLPDALALPADAVPLAVTRAPDWIAVVTTDGAVLILSPDGRTLRQTLRLDPAD